MTWFYAILMICLFFTLTVLGLSIVKHSKLHTKPRNLGLVFLVLLFIASTFGIYGWVGSIKILPMLIKREQRIVEISTVITDHLEKVQENPKDLQSWIVLGASFLETGQIDAAVNAFRQSVILSEGNPKLIMAYVKAQAIQAEGSVTDEMDNGLDVVLSLEPNNKEAQYLKIVRKVQDGNTDEAMKEMKALYRSLPRHSSLKKTINRRIGKSVSD